MLDFVLGGEKEEKNRKEKKKNPDKETMTGMFGLRAKEKCGWGR